MLDRQADLLAMDRSLDFHCAEEPGHFLGTIDPLDLEK
jgi:hypothetical protein